MADISPRTQHSVDAWAGNTLRIARAKTGLTQRELAAKAGVPYSTIAKIESGTRQPTHPTLAKILAAADLALSTRLVPYGDHDDVLWQQEPQRSQTQQVQITAELKRLAHQTRDFSEPAT